MGDTFANPYGADSPLGAALKNLSTTLAKPSGEAANIHRIEAALALKQKRENTAGLGDALRNLGTDQFDRRAAIDLAVRGGVSPDHVGGFERYNSANQYGAADQRTSNAVVGAGGAFNSTAMGAREAEAAATGRTKLGLAENARQFNDKPYEALGPNGQPQVMTQSSAVGQRPILSEANVKGVRLDQNFGNVGDLPPAEQRILGAQGTGTPTPRNYVHNGVNYITNDGLTDARSGQPLPPGGHIANAQGPADAVGLTKTVRGGLQKQNIANDKFKSLLALTRKTAEEGESNFGVPGFVKGAVQDASAVADGLSRGLGYTGLQEGLASARERAIQAGVDPGILSGVFDPTLPKLHSLADLTVFAAAEALAGQSGRSVSDKDIKFFKNIAGDPREWSMSQQKYVAKVEQMGEVLDMYQGVIDKHLPRGNPAAGPGAPGAAASPMSPAPGMQPQAPPVVKWGRGPDGLPVPVQ